MTTSPPHATAAPALQVRHLRIDLSQGFARHWLGGDAFRTQFFNAQSMSFPLGEQYFIDAVRAALPLLTDPVLKEQAQGFIGQEATHRHLHVQYNAHLVKQGLQYWIEPLITWRICASQKLHIRSKLAITMAYEHFTAICADGILGKPQWVQDAQEPLKTLWTWHSAEEIEHKSVAFDVYHAIGGGFARRVAWYVYVGLVFSLDSMVQTTHCLYRDGQLFTWRTWCSALGFFWGGNGLFWFGLPQYLAYFSPRFSPWKHNNRALAEQWMQAHGGAYRSIGTALPMTALPDSPCDALLARDGEAPCMR